MLPYTRVIYIATCPTCPFGEVPRPRPSGMRHGRRAQDIASVHARRSGDLRTRAVARGGRGGLERGVSALGAAIDARRCGALQRHFLLGIA